MANSAEVHMPIYSNSIDNDGIDEPIMEFRNYNDPASVTTVAVQMKKQNQHLKIAAGILSCLTLLFLFLFVYSTSYPHLAELKMKYAEHPIISGQDKTIQLNEVIDKVSQYELKQLEDAKLFKKSQKYQWSTLVSIASQKTSIPFELDDYNNEVVVVVERGFSKYDMHLNFTRLNPDVKVSKVYYTINNSDGDITNVTTLCKINQTQYNNKQFEITFFSISLGGSTIDIRLQVETPQVSSQSFSYDGILMWKIHLSDINNTKSNVRTLDSPYFYTHSEGYRMILQLNSPLFEFHLKFICSNNDQNLPEIFSFRATFTLFNQDNPRKSMVISNDYHNGPVWSTYAFSFDYEHIEKGNFIKDQTILVNLVIQPLPSE
ncbi:hypothetical protein CHUAL_011938 [Chamberlinius hualienensis]